jgi:hypothetical protein
MCVIITVIDKATGDNKKLTKAMITSISEHQDGTACIYLKNEDISFDTVETYDWVNSSYQKLKE